MLKIITAIRNSMCMCKHPLSVPAGCLSALPFQADR